MENLKKTLRRDFLRKRKNISPHRREISLYAATQTLYEITKTCSFVLSFYSKKEELNLQPLNEKLCQEKRLLLPRTNNYDLEVYQVLDLKKLILDKGLQILQPFPNPKYRITVFENIGILVPGIAFDDNGNRIGYGMGYYDRFLKSKTNNLTIGVGFKEQKYSKILPIENHDISLTKVALF